MRDHGKMRGRMEMKKLCGALLCLFLLVGAFLLTAAPAHAAVVDSGSCGDNLTWTLDDAGKLTISGTGAMTDYSWSGSPFFYRSAIKTVVINSGVTRIGDYAFYGCNNMTSVSIPPSVKSIGENAFGECYDLQRVDITDLGAWCRISFGDEISNPLWYNRNGNYGASIYINGERPSGAVTIPSGATSIPAYTFKNCAELTSVTIPSSVKSIGAAAFRSCGSLTRITIPDSVTELGESAFSGCGQLSRAVIGSGVTAIGDNTFSGCSNLTRVTLGSGLTSIGYRAFLSCSGLTSLTIPDGVTSIGSSAFSGCSGLTSMTLGSGLTSIGGYAFQSCSALTSLTVPNGVTSIGGYAFSCCSGLTSLTLGSGLTSIGEAAFADCSGLTSLTVPNAVKSIGASAFSGCSGLTTVKLSKNLTNIDQSAFFNCESLQSVTVPSGVRFIGVSAFSGCSALTAANVPEGITDLLTGTFRDCAALKSVDLPHSLEYVGASAFSGCAALEEVTYHGTKAEWAALIVEDGNDPLLNAALRLAAAPVSISSVKASKTAANVGEKITWTVTTSGGTGTVQCCFYIYNGSTLIQKGGYSTAKTVTYTPDAAGIWKVKAFVKDSSGTAVSLVGGEVTVGSNEPLTVKSLTADKSPAKVGDKITWTASATGGTGTLKYCFYVYNGSTVVQKGTYGTAKTFSYTPTEAGTYKAKVFVKDGAGTVLNKTDGAVTVGSNTPLTLSSVKADKTSAKVGDTITWTASATGGTGTLK